MKDERISGFVMMFLAVLAAVSPPDDWLHQFFNSTFLCTLFIAVLIYKKKHMS